MDLNEIRTALTLLGFIGFVGIVIWAYSGRRFDVAEALPFADEAGAGEKKGER